MDALGYLLESSHIHGHMQGILLSNDSKIVNNHFVDDSLLSNNVEQCSINKDLACLQTFFYALGVAVSYHKIDFWLVRLNSPLDRIPIA